MKKEFVPYQQSLQLKELGFDEPCFGRYYYKESYPMLNPNSGETELVFEFGQYIKQTEITILAPLYQQAFRWFREKYDLKVTFPYWNGFNKMTPEKLRYKYEIMIIPANQYTITVRNSNGGIYFEKYEEAELACLNKLIEIVKKNKENEVDNISEDFSGFGSDTCLHNNVTDIGYTDNLPHITGDNSKFYNGFCTDCEKIVYGRTGKKRIRWTSIRNIAWGDT
jgi:hypothetical protein